LETSTEKKFSKIDGSVSKPTNEDERGNQDRRSSDLRQNPPRNFTTQGQDNHPGLQEHHQQPWMKKISKDQDGVNFENHFNASTTERPASTARGPVQSHPGASFDVPDLIEPQSTNTSDIILVTENQAKTDRIESELKALRSQLKRSWW